MKKYGFIHIPKTGGTSFNEVVEKSKDIHWIGHSLSYDNFERPSGWSFPKIKPFNKNEYDTIFTIVRNPYNLLISYYHNENKKGWGNCNRHHKFNTWDEFLDAYVDEKFKWHFPILKKSLFSFIYDENGDILVDFYFKIENVDHINNFLITNNLNTLPHNNKSTIKKNRQYYTKTHVKKLNEIWEKDLIYFNYSYDGQ